MLESAERKIGFGGFQENTITPDWRLQEEAGYQTFGVVVLIRNKDDELLWTRSAVNKPETGNGAGQWQCGVCETSEPDDCGPVDTALRGLREELGPEIASNLILYYLGEMPFGRRIMARVLLAVCEDGQNIKFSFPDGEIDRAKWLPVGMTPAARIRTASYFVLLMLGKERLQKHY